MTVEEMLGLGLMEGCEVIAGAGGLFREVTWCVPSTRFTTGNWVMPGLMILHAGQAESRPPDPWPFEGTGEYPSCVLISCDTAVAEGAPEFYDAHAIPLIRYPTQLKNRTFLRRFAAEVSRVFDSEQQTEEWLRRMCLNDSYYPTEVMGELRGWRPNTSYACVLASCEHAISSERYVSDMTLSGALNMMVGGLSVEGARAMGFVEGESAIACLAPLAGDGERQLGERARATMEALRAHTGEHWILCIGTPARTLSEFRESYLHASETRRLVTSLGVRSSVCAYDDWFMHMLLLKRPEAELAEHMENVLAPILENHELMETLTTYLYYGEQLKLTSKGLGIHANTVKYRLERIEKRLGADLADTTTRFRLRMAVTIWRYLENGEDGGR